MGRKALGRGLDALMPGASEPAPTGVREIDIDLIDPNPFQPRDRADDPTLSELADSIRATGIIQPIIVRVVGRRYEIIAGERRWRAARLAGNKSIPVLVREVSADDRLILALIENVQRRDLNPIEEAQAYQSMIKEFHLTQEDIARKVGKPRATVANYLRLLKLPEKIMKMVGEDRLSMGHAKVLLSLEREEEQIMWAERTARKQWSVRELESQLKKAQKPRKAKSKDIEDPDWQTAKRDLERFFGGRVRFRRQGEKAVVLQVVFSNWETLDHFYRQIQQKISLIGENEDSHEEPEYGNR